VVRDGVPPLHQFVESILSIFIFEVGCRNDCPECGSESPELGPDLTRLCVAATEGFAEKALRPQQILKKRRYGRHQIVHAFRVEIPDEPLEFGRKQHHIGSIELLGGVPSASLFAADPNMRRLDLVQSRRSFAFPP